ncbi:MAG: ABC transporter permease subunit [Candidatus Paceibacteria bacterium]
MLCAYAISIFFSFFFGILIIHNKRAYEFIFPILDVLQSIPILGFLPFALMFFAGFFPTESFLGPELSSIFLIFTSMTWAVVFSVVESGASITYEIRDLAKILNFKGMQYLTNFVLPISFPQFVSGSIAAWGGGWYFLVAAEYLTWGNNPIALPGLGSFISNSAFSYDLVSSAIGIAMLAFIVIGMNIYVWQPLLARSKRYSYTPLVEEEALDSKPSPFIPLLENLYGKIRSVLERMHKPTERLLEWLSITPAHSTSHEYVDSTPQYILTALIAAFFVYILIFRMPALLWNLDIFSFITRSVLRIGIAFTIALIWTSAVAIFFGRNKRAMAILMPLLDLGQSIPAVSIFPIIVIVVLEIVGNMFCLVLGLDYASILQVMT